MSTRRKKRTPDEWFKLLEHLYGREKATKIVEILKSEPNPANDDLLRDVAKLLEKLDTN